MLTCYFTIRSGIAALSTRSSMSIIISVLNASQVASSGDDQQDLD